MHVARVALVPHGGDADLFGRFKQSVRYLERAFSCVLCYITILNVMLHNSDVTDGTLTNGSQRAKQSY
jgi:hypothetical protein